MHSKVKDSTHDFCMAFHGKFVSGTCEWQFKIEFEFTATPPDLRLSVYFAGACRSRTLHSQRFDFKERACRGDLQSRLDWATADFTKSTGGVFALSSLEIRGKNVSISSPRSWNPWFAILRWRFREFHIAIDVRPSPPFRDWVIGESRPLSWLLSVTQLGRQLGNLRTHRPPGASSSPDIPGIPIPASCARVHYFYCQYSPSVRGVSCQSDSVVTRDAGAGIDLIHLEPTVAFFDCSGFIALRYKC